MSLSANSGAWKRAQSKTGTPKASASFPPQRAKAEVMPHGRPKRSRVRRLPRARAKAPTPKDQGPKRGWLPLPEGLHPPPARPLHPGHQEVKPEEKGHPKGVAQNRPPRPPEPLQGAARGQRWQALPVGEVEDPE